MPVAIGIIAIGIASILEELQGLRHTLADGLRYFGKTGEPPTG
jgi:hypothetical protein